MINNLEDLIEVSYQTADDKGWHENWRWIEKWVLLHSEVSEAFEEYRSGRVATWTGENGKPEGFFIEIADLVIRLADIAGFYNWTLSLEDCDRIIDGELADHELTISEYVWFFDFDIYYLIDENEVSATELAYSAFRGAEILGHDLWESINLKLEYNKTRSYRHGGKVA